MKRKRRGPPFWTRKRKAYAAAYFAIAAGAGLWFWTDKAAAALLIGFGIWSVGKLQREWFPRDRDDYSDGHKTPGPERK